MCTSLHNLLCKKKDIIMNPLTKKYYFKWDRTIYPEDSYIQYSVFRQNNKHTNINNYADFKKSWRAIAPA